jgi:hypothetical protein
MPEWTILSSSGVRLPMGIRVASRPLSGAEASQVGCALEKAENLLFAAERVGVTPWSSATLPGMAAQGSPARSPSWRRSPRNAARRQRACRSPVSRMQAVAMAGRRAYRSSG